jgi:D-3-phosphoglycerate dehydrogenase
MKLLAISDHYIPRRYMEDGLASLGEFGVEVDVFPWEHAMLEELQEANLKIELGGPDAVPLPEDLYQIVGQYDIIVTQFPPIPTRLIEVAERLKVIGVLRGGVENIAVDTATQRNIAVFNTPGRNARAVAECTIGLILAEIRNIARGHDALKRGLWTRDFPNKNDIPELLGRTVGLIGFGAIGRLVAKFLDAFGANIIVYDPFYQKGGENDDNIVLVDLETLMRQSDIVSIHARYLPETHHLVHRELLLMMKPTAILVNTARSGLVDEKALLEVLTTRKITGAALDVFDEEPLPVDSPFLALDNITIVPHLAGSTMDAFRNSPKLFASHLIRCFQGEKNLPVVNGVTPKFC